MDRLLSDLSALSASMMPDCRLMLKYLRIAVTALCLTACLLLIALWARSYVWMDQFIRQVSPAYYFGCTSIDGQLMLGLSNNPPLSAVFGKYGRMWIRRGFPLKKWDEFVPGPVAHFPSDRPRGIACWPRFRTRAYRLQAIGAYHYEAVLPYWLLVLFAAAIAVLSSNKLQFSLRILIIALPLTLMLLGIVRALGG